MLCSTCFAWDADENARFCGHCSICLVPIAVALKSHSLDRTDAGAAAGFEAKLQLRQTGRKPADPQSLFDNLFLSLRTRPENRSVGLFPLEKTLLNAKAGEQKVSLDADWVHSLGGGALVLEPLIVSGKSDARIQDAPPSQFQPRLKIDEPPPAFQVIDSDLTWRGNFNALEIPLRLTSGGTASVRKAVLALRSGSNARTPLLWRSDVQLDWEPRNGSLGIVEADEPLLLVFDIPDEKAAALRVMPMPLEADLSLFDQAGNRIGDCSVRVVRGGPALPVLTIALGPVNALAGRRSRIALAISNKGGSPVDIVNCAWRLRDIDGGTLASGEAEALDQFPRLPITCQPSQMFLGELAIPMTKGDNALAVGLYDVELTLTCSTGALLPAHSVVKVVAADKPVAGEVCIDFGTTESAAAIVMKGSTWPKPIELGRVALHAGDDMLDGELFLPTIATAKYMPAMGKMDWLFGNQAQSTIDAVEPGSKDKLLAYDRLKWSLDTEGDVLLPDNSLTPMVEIATKYIGHVIERIETHPDICALVKNAFITKPAIYRDGQSQLLVAAFEGDERKEFVRWFYNGEDAAKMLLSESWSPLYAVLPRGHAVAKEVFNEEAIVEAAELAEGVNAVVFDIGGGSLDVSLFLVEEESSGTKAHLIRELYSTTSVEFCGRNFSDLIDKEIEAILAARFSKPGKTNFREMGISVSRSGAPVTPESTANREALIRLRNFFQSDNGAFSRFQFGGTEFAENPTLTDGEAEERMIAAMAAALDLQLRVAKSAGGELEERIDIRRLAPQIVLVGRDEAYTHKLTPLEVTRLLARIAAKMVRRYRQEIDDLISRIRALLAPDKRTAVMLTGRGGLFPMAFFLLSTHAQDSFPRSRTFRANGIAAKWITSVGGAIIGKDNAEDVDIAFSAKIQGVYAVVAGKQSTREGGPIYVDFLPGTLGDGEPVGVMSLSRLKKKLSRPNALIEIVNRFESGTPHETVCQLSRGDLGDFDADKDWLALVWREGEPPRARVIRNAPDQAAAMQTAKGLLSA